MNKLLGTAFSGLLCMAVVAWAVGSLSKPASTAAPLLEAKPSATAMFAEEAVQHGTTTIRRDGSGQFRLIGRVNGSEEKFLVDTGADIVALTIDAADAAGIHVDPSSFAPILKTASGEGRGAHYTVREFEIAGRVLRDMDVVVVEGLATNLLGQSALRQLGRIELRGDSMVISQE